MPAPRLLRSFVATLEFAPLPQIGWLGLIALAACSLGEPIQAAPQPQRTEPATMAGGTSFTAFNLQDSAPSPSDASVQPPAVPIPTGPSGAATNAQPLFNTPPQSTTQAQAPTTQPPARPQTSPNVRSLGRNDSYRSLGLGGSYVSPFTSLTTLSSTNRSSNSSSYFGSASHRQLQRTPEMFGDYRRPGSLLTFGDTNPSYGTGPETNDHDDDAQRPEDFPTASSFGGMRISENNMALPQDRVWLGYNHYHNAYAQPGGDLSLDRFVFGLEKTFFGETSSVELRLPIAASIDPNGSLGSGTDYSSGSFGNLSAILKHVLYSNNKTVLAGGLGIEIPTGSQSHATNTINGPASFTVAPAAVYLTPFLGGLHNFDEVWFANGFLQIDVPTGGDKLIAMTGSAAPQTFYLNQPTWLQIDLGGGAWLIAPDARHPFGLALVSEIHIATALNGPDVISVDPNGGLTNVFVNDLDTIDTLVNLTNAVHASFDGGWSARCGIAVPVIDQRIFDTEILVQLNRNY